MTKTIDCDEIAGEIEAEMPELVRKSRTARDRSERTANNYIKTAGGIDLAAVVPALKAAREDAGLTLAEVSEASGITVPTLSKLETGLHGNPTVRTLRRYAEALGKKLVVKLEDV